MYRESRKDKNKGVDDTFEFHYNICFIIIAMAIFGPYIIQYSSMMNAIHHKGYFKKKKFNRFSCIK